MKIPERPKQTVYPHFCGKLAYNPYTGEADTLRGWAERYGLPADSLRYYVHKHSWDDFFTFFPLVQDSHSKYRKHTKRVRR